jgi:hypothetical protein
MRDNFEFHASDMWNGNGPFEKLKRDEAETILKECIDLVASVPLRIVYGAVDKKKLSEQIYSSAVPIEMAFRLCMDGLIEWLKTMRQPLAILIFDEPRNDHEKKAIKQLFRQYRRTRRSFIGRGGKLESHVLDDMFFGSSADSIGIQTADVVNFIIGRHLAGKEDTEYLYKMIEPVIFSGKVFPE